MAQVTRIPVFGTSDEAKSYLASMQKRVNCRLEKLPTGDDATFLYVETPALDEFLPGVAVNLGSGPVRGWHVIGDFLYACVNDKVYKISNVGTIDQIGQLNTTAGLVSMASNGKYPNNQLAIADGQNLYVYTTNQIGFGSISGLAYPKPTTVCFIDGYFLISYAETGRWQWAGINDLATESVNGLDYANAEEYPDPLLNIQPLKGIACMFGTRSIELWSDSGAKDSPFVKNVGNTLDVGLGARWSIAKFSATSQGALDQGTYQESLVFLATDRLGEFYIARLIGDKLTRISTPAIDAEINRMSSKSDAVAYSYIVGSSSIYVINFPSANKTFLYDGGSGLWSHLEDHLGNRHRSHLGIQFFNRVIVSDYATGLLYRLNTDRHTDLSTTQNYVTKPFEITTQHLRSHGYVSIAKLELLFEPSDTTETGEVMLSVSRDGGATFGTILSDSMGAAGETERMCSFRNLGVGRDWVFKIRVTDNVRRRLIGAWLITR